MSITSKIDKNDFQVEGGPKFRHPPNQTMQAMVIPIPLFSQMVELIRGNVCHRDADPIIQQCAQLQPQTVNFKPPE